MKNSPNKILPTLKMLYLFLFLIILPLSVHAQTAGEESSGDKVSDKKDKGSKLALYAETGIEYTDNVFGLTDGQILGMETNDAVDKASSRYKDMKSVSDYIISPTLGFEYAAKSPLGGRFGVASRIRHNYYNKNSKNSYPEFRLRLKNSIGEGGSLSAEGNISWGIFKKNYLSAINDANHNGNIARSERTYSPGIYDEYEAIIAYEQKIIKDKDKTISGLELRPFVGYASRIYDRFGNRDQDILSGGLGITIGFISRIDLEMIYKYEAVSSPNKKEYYLIDESLYGDVSGDGDIKLNAPLLTRVDRSSKRHTIEINPSFELSKGLELFAGYKRRTSTYTSENPLDVEHYDNDALRKQIKSGLKYKFSKAWSVEAEYSKADSDDDEDGEYSQKNYLLTVKFDIL
jgi:hypothetical protein